MNPIKSERTKKTSCSEWENTLPATKKVWSEEWREREQFDKKFGAIREAIYIRLPRGLSKHARDYICQEIAIIIFTKGPENFERWGITEAHKKLRNYISFLCSKHSKRYLKEGEKGERRDRIVIESTQSKNGKQENKLDELSYNAWATSNKSVLEYEAVEIKWAIEKLNHKDQLLVQCQLHSMTIAEITAVHFPEISYNTIRNKAMKSRVRLLRVLKSQR